MTMLASSNLRRSWRALAVLGLAALLSPAARAQAALPAPKDVPFVAWDGREAGVVKAELEAAWGDIPNVPEVIVVMRPSSPGAWDRLPATGIAPYHELATANDKPKLTGGQMMHVYVGGAGGGGGGGLLSKPKVLGGIAIVGWAGVIGLTLSQIRLKKKLGR